MITPPWDGRHTGVLGLEDGCAAGRSAMRRPVVTMPSPPRGAATALALGADVTHTMRHAIAVFDAPDGFGRVRDVVLDGDELRVKGAGDAVLCMAFDPAFFAS